MFSMSLQQMTLPSDLWASQGGNGSYSSLLQAFPPRVSETIQKCARAPGFLSFCWGLHWNNMLMIRVSEDGSQMVVWFGPTADSSEDEANKRRSTGGRRSGVEQPGWQSDGKQQQRILIGVLAQSVRQASGSPSQQQCVPCRSGPQDWPVAPEGRELVKRSWSGL